MTPTMRKSRKSGKENCICTTVVFTKLLRYGNFFTRVEVAKLSKSIARRIFLGQMDKPTA
jgi:hypothetical protein